MMRRLLSKGSVGTDVNELQSALNFHIRAPAEPLVPDGKFGRLTDERVKQFQRLAGIKDDGIVGPNTFAALYRTVQGVIEAKLTPHKVETPRPAFRQAAFAGRQTALQGSALVAEFPGLGQVGPVIPDFVPPSRRIPQIRAASSQGFEVEARSVFNPLADTNDGEHPFRLTLSPALPWPVFLPVPLKLDIEVITPGVGRFQVDAKMKAPFTLIKTKRFELSPYFFVGAGMNQDNFKELNAGGGGSVKLKVLDNIFGSGLSLGVEADGGAKYNLNRDTGESKLKGFVEGAAVIEFLF